MTVDPSGAITTSIDTEGGWTPFGGSALPDLAAADTVLLRLAPDGSPRWMRAIGGAGPQRGKALAVAPDRSVSFGGDTIGALTLGGMTANPPATGGGRDAWLARWSSSGGLHWVATWGGPGDDLTKGVVDDGQTVSYVGPFTGRITVGTATLDAGQGADLLVAPRSTAGAVHWATSVTGSGSDMDGAEVIGANDGGILFGSGIPTDLAFGSPDGVARPLDASDGGVAWLAHYRPDGTPAFARTIAGTTLGRLGEIDRTGNRVYVDVTLRGSEYTINGRHIAVQGKDASVWALDLP